MFVSCVCLGVGGEGSGTAQLESWAVETQWPLRSQDPLSWMVHWARVVRPGVNKRLSLGSTSIGVWTCSSRSSGLLAAGLESWWGELDPPSSMAPNTNAMHIMDNKEPNRVR